MQDYIFRLQTQLKELNYDEQYINLCIQYSARLLENNLPVIFDYKHLSLLTGLKSEYLQKLYALSDDFYNLINIPKKSGGYRKIQIPTAGLKLVQRWILDNILYAIPVSPNATGFVPNRSIMENAKKHVNQQCLINLDIKDFFPSISIEQVFRIFRYYGYTNDLSYILSKLCTFDGKLPQGAPTSPYISNIICLKLDKRLSCLGRKIKANYSRYADDMSFSGDPFIINYLDVIKRIIYDEGFVINEDKTRIQFRHQRQQVTGLVVNEKVSVPRELKRYLRQQIYYCRKFGVNKHLKSIENNRSNYKEYLYGIAHFINMVESDIGRKYLEDLNNINWEY